METNKSATSLHIQTNCRNMLQKKILLCGCVFLWPCPLLGEEKVLLVFLTMCYPYQEKDLCLSPWHESLKGQRPPKEASGFVLDAEQSIFFCQVSCLTKHGKKYPSTVTLLWLWREQEFCWLMSNLQI